MQMPLFPWQDGRERWPNHTRGLHQSSRSRYQPQRRSKAVSETTCRDVAQLGARLGFINGIATVMALAILDIALEVSRSLATRGRGIWKAMRQGRVCRENGIHSSADFLDRLNIAQFLPAADVVDLARSATREAQFDPPAVILDMKPVAHVHAVAVDRQLAAVQCVQQEERDQLLRKLEGPVIVRAIAGRRLQPVGVVVGAHQMVGARLGRGIRRVRRVGAWFR